MVPFTPVTCHNDSIESWKEPSDIGKHNRSGFMLNRAFSQKLAQRVQKHGAALGHKSRHNHPEHKSCSSFYHCKRFLCAQITVYLHVFLKTLLFMFSLSTPVVQNIKPLLRFSENTHRQDPGDN
ncbi:hypothetical protein ATANTOWER_030324 [Ataeniobius toweri]|uniref:Uncharacterized protein n=1 Tax=Ataeniobius toweri TaxID=208326 RepID=A0ABU7BVA3_9TELE|nr:hypothetical protein [Ataeniobius toweri]